MNNFKLRISKVFHSYKCKESSDELKHIPIYNNNNELIGFLKPVTFHYKTTSPEYISLFGQWRKENPVGFASIFEISDKRTTFWLDDILLKREDRILFVIQSEVGTPLGHIGLSSFNFENKCCEIDNVVRGIKKCKPGMMSFALEAIIEWGKKTLEVDNIFLRVLKDNLHAIEYYERNGFIKEFDIPLYKVVQEDEIKWIETKEREDQKPDRHFTYMRLK
jgi:RimJ/RimL family protein N-acetyltransferase